MTMAQPQALTTSEGWQEDVAKRNETVRVLAHRLSEIKKLHRRGYGSALCDECLNVWPCTTVQLAKGETDLS
jgi:hypothetical protein